MLVTPSSDVYFKRASGSFAVPSADVTDGTGPLYIPAGASRLVQLGDAGNIGMVSAAACIVQLEWFE